jgi:C-terminal processing protease CtpA/Prc
MVKRRSLAWFFILMWLFIAIQYSVPQESTKALYDPEKKYTIEQLQKDFDFLRTALEEAHAGLYFYTLKQEMDSLFDHLYKDIDRSMTELEFYRYLAPLVASINDGHTGMMPSKDFDAYLQNQPILIPFKLLFIDRKAYLFRNYSEDEDFVLGGEVVSINDRPMTEILEMMLAIQPSDGHNVTSKYRRLESTTAFGRRFAQLFGITTSFKIVYISPKDGQKEEIQVQGLKQKELTQIFSRRYPVAAQDRPPIEIKYEENVAILTIRTFSSGAYNGAKISFPYFMKKTFRELSEKNIQHLVIDLRDNGGGEDLFGRILFSYLIDKPYMYYNFLEVKNNTFSSLAHTEAPDIAKMLQKSTRKNERGTYDILVHANLGEQKPMKPTFLGRVYVLINGGSFSGSGETTSLMHYHKRAVFIGEECGAGYYGNTSGLMPTLTLPQTQLRMRIPMVRYHMAVSGYDYPDRGIIPDYPFTRTIEDHLNGKDTEMDYVLDLIKTQK